MKTIKKVANAQGAKTTTIADAATIKVIKEMPRDTTIREGGFIYKFQLSDKKLKEKEAKKLRGKIRRQLQAIINKIIVANAKKEDFSGIADFLAFYKANYIINDLSLQSITSSSDELKHADLTKVLNLAKKVKETKKK